MENLEIYENVRTVPDNAQREIQGGKLKGKTDINPMWRIKTLTEKFGICGFGWKTRIINKWIETGSNGENAAFVEIELYVKIDGQWSDPIIGIGGSMLVNTERGNLATNDECFKMAYTDAISVACKALGFGADIYWSQDTTKYDGKSEEPITPEPIKCDKCGKIIKGYRKKDGTEIGAEEAKEKCGGLCAECYLEKNAKEKAEKANKTQIEEVEV